VLQDGNFEDCYRLVNVGENAGSEPMKWVNEVWPQQKGNHGLCLLDVPHEATGFVNVNAGNPDARREKEKYEYKDEDEKDLMLNRLRALYMQLVLRPGGFNSLATWFKVRTLKNGLVRLGVYTKDLDEKVQAEAKTLAKIRTVETLEEALLEQASLFDPGKDTMTGNKVKNCLKNLERLGFTLTDGEFAALRDKANRDMYELAEKELAATAGQTGDFAGNRVKQLQKLSARLRAESNIGFRGEA
jgi:hypothetical protein